MTNRSWGLRDLRPDQCKVGVPGMTSGHPLHKRVCCKKVVDESLQLCSDHIEERERLLALFREKAESERAANE